MDWHYPRNRLAEDIMDGVANRGQPAYLLFERRRMGKTKFLQIDLEQLARRKKWVTLYATFYESRVSGEILLSYELNRACERRQLNLPIGTVKKLEAAKLAGIEFYEKKSAGAASVPPDLLSAMDEMIDELAKHDPLLLMLDEFQDVLRHPKPEAFLKQLRSSIDKRPGRVAAVFTGSNLKGLSRIFEDGQKPFYGFATRLPFPEFDEDFVDHCRKGFSKRTGETLDRGEALEAFNRLDRVTGHFRKYVENRLLTGDDHETALGDLQREFAEDFRFLNLWLSLSPPEQAFLTLLQQGIDGPYTLDTRERYASTLGLAEAPERRTIQSVMRKLTRKSLIDQDEDTKRYLISDPRFDDFIYSRRRAKRKTPA
ncbi:MAG: hypothetical protein AAFX86_01545 [Pseudomonadota bacterium]